MTKQINGKDVEVIQSHSWRGILDKMFKLQREGYTVYESLTGHNSKSGTIIKLTMMKDQYTGVIDTSDLNVDKPTNEVDNPVKLGEPTGTVETDSSVGFVFENVKDAEKDNVDQKPAEPAKRGRKKAE